MVLGVADVVRAARTNPSRIGALVASLSDPDPMVRMRCADALEKLTIGDAAPLQAHRAALLRLAGTATQQELRWHLCQILPRLRLTATQRARAAALAQAWLSDPSRIVRTLALQALADLAGQDARLRPMALEAVREAAATGTPAMQARARKILKAM
jgi:hypothetical protein